MKTRYGFLLLLTALLAASCAKEVLQPAFVDLGTKTVDASKGNFQVLVRSDVVWSVSTEDDWITVDPGWHRNASSFVVQYSSNESIAGDCRFNRVGHVKVTTYDGALIGTLELRQKGIVPFIAFDQSFFPIPSGQGTYSLPLMTNLGDAQRVAIRVSTDASWLVPFWGTDGRSVSVEVQAGTDRSATVRVEFVDDWGGLTFAECTVNQ